MTIEKFRKNVKRSLIVSAFILLVGAALFVPPLFAESTNETSNSSALGSSLAYIGAAIAFFGGALGAGIAVGHVGSAAMGAISEKPEMASQALIFIALGEGLVIFGFITALIILGKA